MSKRLSEVPKGAILDRKLTDLVNDVLCCQGENRVSAGADDERIPDSRRIARLLYRLHPEEPFTPRRVQVDRFVRVILQ